MDLEKLKSLLDTASTDPAWTDADGNTLLHHAARLGDLVTVTQCFARGMTTLAYNRDNECPHDIARIWGHDAVAEMIGQQMRTEKNAMPAPALNYASLDEIRHQQGLLHTLAHRGLLDQIVPLVTQDPVGLTAQDLLEKGLNGNTVILEICEQGQLPLLLKPELWVKNAVAFQQVWDHVPRTHQAKFDSAAFVTRIQQLKLRMTVKPQRKPPPST